MAPTSASLIADLEFSTLLPNAPFTERHSRRIAKPIDEVWPALLQLPGDDIRLLRPMFQLRGIPARLLRREAPVPAGSRPALDLFEEEGFVMLRRDQTPVDGHATLIFGAAGRFWSPAHNAPVPFDSPQAFIDFAEPGTAKTVARFEAFAEGDHTRVETETIVVGTDPASTRKFGAYWMLIRGPSGLIRRSWLAAIDRRASQ